ncbi:hypothetical protein JKA74_03820 [Marivirga sp. S37H4]|uniref:DUF3575 domain-containing protein n=1 Tax=Marivirga aurantiaca TaxID=2802615 RepID=A0A934WWA1_9BACT|nr:hypothetical protein [Marivirga aurantiaca]MBK6264154.1 hypothetical protein [Marivirga aurantiaca]
MRAILFLFFLIPFLPFTASSQKYGTAAGIRFGEKQFGISLRQQIIKQTTAELMVEFGADEVQATLLPKYHINIIGKGLNLYLGVGAHVGNLKDFGMTYGVDMMAGLELKLPAIPITISADFKPAYHFQHEDWFALPGAFSIHYVISKDTREKRKKVRAKKKRRKERRKLREERREKRQEWFDKTLNQKEDNK